MDELTRSRAGVAFGSRTILALITAIMLITTACGGGAGSPAPASPAGGTPVPESPAAETPAAETPAGESPAAESPAAESPAAESPAAESPAAESPAAMSPAAVECPDTAQGQTLEMWSPLTGPDGDEMTALAQRFSSENEWGITVNHVPQPDYMQSLTAAAATPEQLPEMTIARVINVGELAARNVLKPWGDEALAVLGEDFESQFAENVWVRGEYNGERYSIPLDFAALVMYYNKDMFAAAGVEEPGTEPWTREEFEEALTALQGSGVQAISIGTAFQAATLFQTFIVQFGGSVANEDGTQATYNSPEGVEALEYIKNLRDTHGTQASGTGDPEVQPFTQGQAAIVIHGPWHISNLRQLEYTGYAPVPQVGDEFAVWGGSHQFALTTDDAALQAAAGCWVSWITQNSLEWAAAGQIPAYTPARESPELETNAPGIAAIAPSAAEGVIILPQVPGLEDALWGRGFGVAVDQILLGEQTDAQAALDQQAQASQQIIDQNAEQYGSAP